MTGHQRRPTISAISVAKLAFAGAIIGGGSLAVAGQASAVTGAEWDHRALSTPAQAWALDIPLPPVRDDPPVPPVPPPGTPPAPALAAGGPPPVPDVPADQQVHGLGQLGYLRQIWHEFHDHPDDVIGGVMPGDNPDAAPGANPDAPPGASAGSPQALPPGAPPLPSGFAALPPDQQPYPLHALPPSP